MSPGNGNGSGLSGDMVSDLLGQASSILAREAGRLPMALPGGPKLGTDLPAVGGVESLLASPSGALPQASGSPVDLDRLRRQAHEILESLLTVLSPKGPPPGVPMLRCVAPVTAGHDGRATLRVANDESAPSEVTLYCSNFVADSGYDIPSVRVTISPRKVTLAPRGETAFEIKIAVPQQTPSGTYSGLLQATGAKYVKAVLSVEVM